MNIKKPIIAVCTAKERVEDTLIYKSLSNVGYSGSVKFCISNKESLSVRYNEFIEDALNESCDCLILVHDDVILEENPIPKLEKLFDNFDLVGVAGASTVKLQKPALWHLMGQSLHGCVQHLFGEKKPRTEFGVYPHRAVMIDGVFMAMNKKIMDNYLFDVKNPAKFHFYDLIFSLDCHKAWCKVGVGDILITHASPGLSEATQEWFDGEKYFLSKYDN